MNSCQKQPFRDSKLFIIILSIKKHNSLVNHDNFHAINNFSCAKLCLNNSTLHWIECIFLLYFLISKLQCCKPNVPNSNVPNPNVLNAILLIDETNEQQFLFFSFYPNTKLTSLQSCFFSQLFSSFIQFLNINATFFKLNTKHKLCFLHVFLFSIFWLKTFSYIHSMNKQHANV